MKQGLKITPPPGYEVDFENSTAFEIVFKPKANLTIKWNQEMQAVEIKEGTEHFYLNASMPSFHCQWDSARRFYPKDCEWTLPTKQQLLLVSKYWKFVEEEIKQNNGYTLEEGYYWTRHENGKEHALIVRSKWATDAGSVFKDCEYYCRSVYTIKKHLDRNQDKDI